VISEERYSSSVFPPLAARTLIDCINHHAHQKTNARRRDACILSRRRNEQGDDYSRPRLGLGDGNTMSDNAAGQLTELQLQC